MADMESFGRTIASLEEELAGLDESLQQEQVKNDMMKAAIAESRAKQQADQTEIYDLIKRLADLECQVEDASSLEGVGSQRPAKSTPLQACSTPWMSLYFSKGLLLHAVQACHKACIPQA